MKSSKQIISGFITVASVAILTLSFTAIPVQTAQAWWKCSNGYQMELKGNNTTARCYKAAVEKSTRACPLVKLPGTNVKVGTQKKKNYKGNTDKCVVLQSGFNVPVTCRHGYSLRTKTGWDKCKKAATERPPSVNVN
jgi:hypothetical protein